MTTSMHVSKGTPRSGNKGLHIKEIQPYVQPWAVYIPLQHSKYIHPVAN